MALNVAKGVTLLRTLAILSVLVTAQAARAQSRLQVYSLDEDQPFRLSIVDRLNQGAWCTLPTRGGCQLTLSPGATHLSVESAGRSMDMLLDLPNGTSGLQLKYHSPALGWVGVGLVGGGLLEVLEAVAFFSAQTTQTGGCQGCLSNADFNTAAAALGVVSLVTAGALFIAGGVLTTFGFRRAGPQAELTALPLPSDDAPAPPLPPPPAFVPSPPPGTPPPVGWEGTRSDD